MKEVWVGDGIRIVADDENGDYYMTVEEGVTRAALLEAEDTLEQMGLALIEENEQIAEWDAETGLTTIYARIIEDWEYPLD